MSNYKLIALDMDGTLLNNEHEISQENRQTILRAKQQGVTVVLASGRPPEGMQRHLNTLDMNTNNDYLLCYNGSLVQNIGTQEIICAFTLTGKQAKQVAFYAQKLGVFVHAFSPKRGLITPQNNPYTQIESDINGIDITRLDFSQLDDNEPIIKVMMVDDAKKLDLATERLDQGLYADFTIVRSATHFLEFIHKKANKGTGIQALTQHLHLEPQNVICMGDAENDHHMLEFAGLGVAMGNATPATKNIADLVTVSNQENGVAKIIQDYMLASHIN